MRRNCSYDFSYIVREIDRIYVKLARVDTYMILLFMHYTLYTRCIERARFYVRIKTINGFPSRPEPFVYNIYVIDLKKQFEKSFLECLLHKGDHVCKKKIDK